MRNNMLTSDIRLTVWDIENYEFSDESDEPDLLDLSGD